MATWFSTLPSALQAEGVMAKAALAQFVPEQFFVPTLMEWKQAFAGFLAQQGHGPLQGIPLCVFVDGVPKRLSTNNPAPDLDACFRRACEELGCAVSWVNVSQLLGVQAEEVHASVEHLPQLRACLRALPQGSVCVVLGSGSLTDLVKHALYLEELNETPFVVVPTALTVTAFSSAFAVLDESGAKRTRVSRPLTAVFWLASVLQSAPMPMSRAGYGDLLARFVAYADWHLGYRLGVMERYDELAFRLMEPFAQSLQDAAAGFGTDLLPLECVESTAAALSMAGIAMSVSGETTPLSGYEHVISHALDFLRLTAGRPLVLHGEQVALATLTSATTLDLLCELEDVDLRTYAELTESDARSLIEKQIRSAPTLDPAVHEHSMKAAIEIFAADYLKKNAKWSAVRPHVRELLAREWPDIRANLQRLTLRARDIERLLRLAKLPLSPEDTVPRTTALEYRWAVRFSPFVRARVSIADFVFWLGEDPAIFAAL